MRVAARPGHRPLLQLDAYFQRRVVFRSDKAGITQLAVDAARLCRQAGGHAAGHEGSLRILAESFTAPSSTYAIEICKRVM